MAIGPPLPREPIRRNGRQNPLMGDNFGLDLELGRAGQPDLSRPVANDLLCDGAVGLIWAAGFLAASEAPGTQDL
jgi:hypothetical protein